MHKTSSVEVTAADELFVNLDGTILPTDGAAWQIEVCGIHQADDRYWVQLNLVGPECYSLTLRTSDLSAGAIRDQVAGCLPELSRTVLANRVAVV